MSQRPILLWTDDDPPGRFEYEQYLIREEGWDIVWAPDVSAAARELAGRRFDALLLDQMLPYEGLRQGGPLWGGALLLRWLRGRPPPPSVRLDPEGPLSRLRPHPDNAELPVVLVSAFHDASVEQVARGSSELDRNLPLVPKPIQVGLLLDLLRKIRPGAAA